MTGIETIEVVADIGPPEDLPTGEMAATLYLHIYHDDWEGQFSQMRVAESLLPTGPVSIFEMTITFRESPEQVATTVEETYARSEVRADYYGTNDYDTSKFVLREIDATDYSSWLGKMGLAREALPEGTSLDFLDLSQELKTHPIDVRRDDDPDHPYPGGEPYSSCYVTLELEHAPDALR